MAARITAYIVAAIVSVTFIAGLIVGAQRDENGPVDLIVLNGRVYTAAGDGGFAEAVAIQGNRVLRVGSTREISRLRRAQTRVIDAKGGAVLPGFIDAQANLLDGGLALGAVDLTGLATLDAVQDEIALWARLHPDARWILGRGWRYEMFPGGPTRQALDRATGARPAYLISADGHTGWANTAALAAAGITRQTDEPVHGAIVRDPRTGEPTGALKEAAMALVARHVPPPSRAEELAALEAAIGEAHRLGITSVQNGSGSAHELELYDELRRTGALTLRVYEALTLDAPAPAAQLDMLDRVARTYPDDPLLKAGAVSVAIDGTVAARTAALLAPYAGTADAGAANFDQPALNALVAELDRRGWQVLLKASGDRAVRMGLEALGHAAEANPAPKRGRRHRLERPELIDPADLPRLGALGVVAAMRPLAALPPEPASAWITSLGPARALRAAPLAGLLHDKAHLVFGSGWPAAPLDPRLGLFAAVNRTRFDGRPAGGWQPDERLPLEAAVDAYTRQAAWASFDDHRKGVIAPDMLADLVVLSRDIFHAPPERIADADVAATIFDGRIVYERDRYLTQARPNPVRPAAAVRSGN